MNSRELHACAIGACIGFTLGVLLVAIALAGTSCG